jgi:hypothetical protein
MGVEGLMKISFLTAVSPSAAGAARQNRRTWEHLALFVRGNLIARRELASKPGHHLGSDADLADDDPLKPGIDAQECHPC